MLQGCSGFPELPTQNGPLPINVYFQNQNGAERQRIENALDDRLFCRIKTLDPELKRDAGASSFLIRTRLFELIQHPSVCGGLRMCAAEADSPTQAPQQGERGGAIYTKLDSLAGGMKLLPEKGV